MNKLDEQRQKEIQQAEELLFAGPQALGFAKGLFQGHFVSDWVMPYPRIPAAEQVELDQHSERSSPVSERTSRCCGDRSTSGHSAQCD